MTKELTNKKLSEIQSTLKAPKGQTNAFGKYKYRSCEDILEAVKPLLDGATLTLSDDVILVGERIYVKATAKFTYQDETIQVSALAREALTKKGMDDSQITGTASSYARKYALNGLFCIDDTKDADTMDNRVKKEPKKESTTPATDEKVKEFMDWGVKNHKSLGDVLKAIKGKYKITAEQEERIRKG